MRGDGRVFQKKGRRTWTIAYYGPRQNRGGSWGEIREYPGTTDKGVAETLLKRRLREVANHHEGIKEFDGSRAQRVTVGELLDALKSDYELRRIKDLEGAVYAMRPVREFFGDMRAVNVRAENIRRYVHDRRKAGRKNATINRGLELLSAAFHRAVKDKVLSAFMVPTIEKLPENNARQEFYNQTELDRLLPYLPRPVDDIARLCYAIGWRRGEIIGVRKRPDSELRWEQVDRAAREVRLFDSKNRDPRVIKLDEESWKIIERQWAAREYATPNGPALSSVVFHRKGKAINDNVFGREFRRACVKVGLGRYEEVRDETGRPKRRYVGRVFHSFRNTAARNMIRAGVPQSVAMKVTGHRTDAMFRRYAIVTTEDMSEALSQTRAYLNRENSGEVANVAPFRKAHE